MFKFLYRVSPGNYCVISQMLVIKVCTVQALWSKPHLRYSTDCKKIQFMKDNGTNYYPCDHPGKTCDLSYPCIKMSNWMCSVQLVYSFTVKAQCTNKL